MKKQNNFKDFLAGKSLKELEAIAEDLKKQIKKTRFESANWCGCENEDADKISYFENDKHPTFKKHHYRCNDCGGVWQIG